MEIYILTNSLGNVLLKIKAAEIIKGDIPWWWKSHAAKLLRENKTCNKNTFYILVMLPKDSVSQKTYLNGYDCTKKDYGLIIYREDIGF